MKKLIVSLVILVSNWCLGVTDCDAKNVLVSSPDGAVMVTVGVKDHHPFYRVDYQGRTLVAPSRLGFRLDHEELGANMTMGKVSRSSMDETYRPLDAGGIPCVQRWFRFQI